jgi:type III restriction enzyme
MDRVIGYREKFKEFEGKIYLPKFVIQEAGGWRDVNYEMDILSRIDWTKVSLDALKAFPLSTTKTREIEVIVGLSEDKKELIKEKGRMVKEGDFEINTVFMTRQILDLVPNPWIAYDISKTITNMFLDKYDGKTVTYNLVSIIEELRKHLEEEKDRLAEQIFRELIEKKVLWFFLLSEKGGYKLPSSIRIKHSVKALTQSDHTPLQRSLFDFVPEDGFNETEKSVAVYLDEQEKLLWWYRNLSRLDYYVQGWKKHKIYPDFIFADEDPKRISDYKDIYVVETKGIHLKNEDTTYKESVFEFCNRLGQQKDWQELNLEFPNRRIEFQVVFEDEWKAKINKIFES